MRNMRRMFVNLGHQATKNSISSIAGILNMELNYSVPIETIQAASGKGHELRITD